jgi:hypothetical protein
MADDKNGVTDAVEAVLNGDATGPDPDAKGPDPDQWPSDERETSRRKVDTFDPGDGEVKGPHPDQWPTD